MSILLTNINESILNENIIKKSYTLLENTKKLKEDKIIEIAFLNEEISTEDWNLKNIKVNKFKIDMEDDMEEVYNDISGIIQDIIDKKEFINVIVDTNFLGYLILEVLIKKFNITDVFILKNKKLEKAHPCGCGEESMGY
jgi:hypothetical protein